MDVDPKGCIYLDNQPLGLTSYQRATTSDLISRFSTSAQGETNLDLLKALSQDSFRGGMFHREFDDGETVNQLTSGYFNELDNSLYMSPQFQRYHSGANGMNSRGVTAWCYFRGYIYIACQNEYPSPGNSLMKFNVQTQATTPITLPSGVQTSGSPITAMIVHKGSIFLTGGSYIDGGATVSMQRFDGNTSFYDLGLSYRKLCSWRGVLYGFGTDSAMCIITNEFATSGAGTSSVVSFVGTIGVAYTVDPVQDMILFNNALYLLKTDGLFRYDGVAVATVFDYSNVVSPTNFQYGAVFNGRLYYSVGSKIYEFDGTTVTLLQDLTAGFAIRSIESGTDRLWVTAQQQDGVPAIWNDKDSSLPYQTYAQHVFCYNGSGWFEYKVFDAGYGNIFNGTRVVPCCAETKVYFICPDEYLSYSLDLRSTGMWYHFVDLAQEFALSGYTSQATSSQPYIMQVVSGDIDNGYPSVPKTLNGIALDYEGFESGKSSILVEAQYFYNGVWSDYTPIFNTQNVASAGASLDYSLHEQSEYASPNLATAPASYNRLRYRLTATLAANSTLTTVPRIRKLTMRFTLQPRMRRQWQLTLAINALDNRNLATGTLDDKDDDRHNNELRKLIYDAYKSKLPILFYDAEYSHVSNVSPLKIKGTSLFDKGDNLAFANSSDLRWINRRVGNAVYDEVNDITTLTLDNFGYRKSLDGAPDSTPFTNNYQVRKSHVVYITQVTNDRIILDPNTMNDKNGYADPPGEITLRLVEV